MLQDHFVIKSETRLHNAEVFFSVRRYFKKVEKVYHQMFNLLSEFIQTFSERVVDDMQIARHKREATQAFIKHVVVDVSPDCLVHVWTTRP